MTDTDYELLNSQLRASREQRRAIYLTRETYSRERVSTLIVSP